jgi:hypothetical protein
MVWPAGQAVKPPGWVLADEAIAADAEGILFASPIITGGTTLVLYSDVSHARRRAEGLRP